MFEVVLPRASNLTLGCKEVSQELLKGLGSMNRPLTREKSQREKNNASRWRLPQHRGAKLSTAV